jgi:hypothetical protein
MVDFVHSLLLICMAVLDALACTQLHVGIVVQEYMPAHAG